MAWVRSHGLLVVSYETTWRSRPRSSGRSLEESAPIGPFQAHATFASASAVDDEEIDPSHRNAYRAVGHPLPPSLDPEIGKRSINPRLVADAGNVTF